MINHKQHLYGLHTVHSFLKHKPQNALTLFVAKDRHDEKIKQILDLAHALKLPIEQTTIAKLNQLTQDGVHQGAVLLAKVVEYQESDLEPLLTELKEQPLLLVLDSIQDPHNLGACLRSAESAGVDLVIIPKDRSATLTPLVRKIATGAAEIIPVVQVTNLRRALQIAQKQGIWFIGLTVSPKAESLYKIKLTGPLGLVLGSEGTGLRMLTEQQCDGHAYIPMQGDIESLNVSVAAGIALFEALRQRLLAK
ncbi:MAG: 23S rRNA (guanosine(2251)-2'-O)-methyltransferase RlmB [Legionellales bacterium]